VADAAPPFLTVATWGGLVGIWTVLAERTVGSLLAFVFATIGAAVGLVVLALHRG
jgi:hypothetical protein